MRKLVLLLNVCIVCSLVFLCGCSNDSSGVKVVPIGGLLEHADVDEKVTVRGYWFDWGDSQQIADDSGFIYAIADNVDTSDLESNVEYSFTGFIRYGPVSGHSNDMLYFEVIDIEWITPFLKIFSESFIPIKHIE